MATHLPILKVSFGIMSKFAALYPPQQYATFDSSSKLYKSYESDEGTPLLTESISTKKREKSAASKVWKRGETLCLKHVTIPHEWVKFGIRIVWLLFRVFVQDFKLWEVERNSDLCFQITHGIWEPCLPENFTFLILKSFLSQIYAPDNSADSIPLSCHNSELALNIALSLCTQRKNLKGTALVKFIIWEMS